MTAYRGKVTNVTAKGVFVRIPKLMPEVQMGPYERPAGIELEPGDTVILLEIERDEDLVVLMKVATSPVSARATLLALNPTQPYHAATKDYVDDAVGGA